MHDMATSHRTAGHTISIFPRNEEQLEECAIIHLVTSKEVKLIHTVNINVVFQYRWPLIQVVLYFETNLSVCNAKLLCPY